MSTFYQHSGRDGREGRGPHRPPHGADYKGPYIPEFVERCATCGHRGHRWKNCRGRYQHCKAGVTYHNGTRCPHAPRGYYDTVCGSQSMKSKRDKKHRSPSPYYSNRRRDDSLRRTDYGREYGRSYGYRDDRWSYDRRSDYRSRRYISSPPRRRQGRPDSPRRRDARARSRSPAARESAMTEHSGPAGPAVPMQSVVVPPVGPSEEQQRLLQEKKAAAQAEVASMMRGMAALGAPTAPAPNTSQPGQATTLPVRTEGSRATTGQANTSGANTGMVNVQIPADRLPWLHALMANLARTNASNDGQQAQQGPQAEDGKG